MTWNRGPDCKSVDVIREKVTMSLSMSCSQLYPDVDVCNLLILVADAFISLINVDHTCMRKTSFPQKCQISSRALHNYSVITLGLLASTFKRTHWLVPGYLLGQAWKNR